MRGAKLIRPSFALRTLSTIAIFTTQAASGGRALYITKLLKPQQGILFTKHTQIPPPPSKAQSQFNFRDMKASTSEE
ncbi:hypothetical protein B9Z19DRAFT_1096017 [Tuber borchii]|uniref:Uncharacterized protein n=1 Tax=Tuber borchii TaxID=42251 RepID=A0A2T6ZBY5_TUBBO|nr:hypothetical protein B9Z19DRAFT_1096017 [Tuber borchii]